MNKITINKNISFYEEAEAFSGVKKDCGIGKR